VGDEDELRGFRKILNQFNEAIDVGIVQGSIDLIEQTEGVGLIMKSPKSKAIATSAFSPPREVNVLSFFPEAEQQYLPLSWQGPVRRGE